MRDNDENDLNMLYEKSRCAINSLGVFNPPKRLNTKHLKCNEPD